MIRSAFLRSIAVVCALGCGGQASGPSARTSGGMVVACTDANIETISDSNYDQSCKVDSDCVVIAEGNACYLCVVQCATGGAINRNALLRYQNDISKTIGAHDEPQSNLCNCPLTSGACCISGVCTVSFECESSDAASK
jgi:hypothetical protein